MLRIVLFTLSIPLLLLKPLTDIIIAHNALSNNSEPIKILSLVLGWIFI